MNNTVKTHHEPLIKIKKRSSKENALPWYKAWTIRTIAILLALIVCAMVIVYLTGYDPIKVYASMIKGNFGSKRKMWSLFQNLSMLLCISLAVTPAFKMRFWNIGAEGQALAGALAASACMIYLGNIIPGWLLIIIMSVCSIGIGVLWGVIPAYFKAKFNTNETLFTLMMNYMALQLVAFFIVFWENPKGSNNVGIINPGTQAGWFPKLFGQQYLINIIIVAVITITLYIYLRYSKHGYEISVVGESENTARYIGINVKKVIIRTMALSGALCGLTGLLLVAGTHHTITTNTVGGMGFTAIMVSWLAKFNPIFMIMTSFLITFLEKGADEIATSFQLNHSISSILTGIIIFFIIGSEFFVNYTFKIRKSHKETVK